MKSPAFQFYPADFLADENVAMMTNQEIGCYIKLMCYCWREGSIPKEISKIAKLCGETQTEIEPIWTAIKICFDQLENNENRLIHPRLESERTKQKSFSEKRSVAGGIGAANRWVETPSKTPSKTRSERLAAARKIGTHKKEEWVALLSICGENCLRCGKADVNLVKDHIEPIYAGGSDSIENIQPLCQSCNSAKGPEKIDYRPDNWEMRVKRLANACQTPGSSFASSSLSLTSSLTATSKSKSKSKPTVANAPPFLLPDWVNSEDWNLWLKTRKGKKMISEQMAAQIKKLDRWRSAGLDYGKALSDAAASGWLGLVEPVPRGGAPPTNQKQANRDNYDRQAREAREKYGKDEPRDITAESSRID